MVRMQLRARAPSYLRITIIKDEQIHVYPTTFADHFYSCSCVVFAVSGINSSLAGQQGNISCLSPLMRKLPF